MTKARVFVTLKQEILDPQGDAVRKTLRDMGYSSVTNVRVGKIIDLDLGSASKDSAQKDVTAMCERLLRNPVIEDARFEIESES